MRVLVDGLRADAVLDPVKTREYLDLLAVESLRLTRLIDSFLTFSKLDRPNQRLSTALVSPRNVVSAALEAIRERVPSACQLHTDIEPDLPLVRADCDSLSTALVNLLDNAIKYSPANPRIGVRVRRDGSFVSFAVSDNGIGIAPREQRRIFERFYRVDQRLARDRRRGRTVPVARRDPQRGVGNAVFVTPRSVDRCIATLRAKVERDPHNPQHIQTLRDVGYRFEPKS